MTLFNRLKSMLPGQRRVEGPVRVVTDSTADIPRELAAEVGIVVIPLRVMFGSESYLDGVDLTSDEFFEKLQQAKDLPTTSQPSVGEFHQLYEGLAGETRRILSIHLSSKFSGTVDAARQAAALVGDEFNVEVIDSGTVSMAMGFAVIAAARAAREGADLDTCARIARSILERQRLAVAVDTLEYLRRGGRIGRATAFLGGLLRLKPVLTIRDGETFPLSRARSRKKALEKILSVCLDGGNVEQAAVMHTTTPDDAAFLAGEVSRRYPDIPILMGRIGPVIGVHTGPGLIGLGIVLKDAPADGSDR